MKIEPHRSLSLQNLKEFLERIAEIPTGRVVRNRQKKEILSIGRLGDDQQHRLRLLGGKIRRNR